MLCDGVPDAKDQRAVNTFVTLWKDYSDSNIGEELQLCNSAVKVCIHITHFSKEEPNMWKPVLLNPPVSFSSQGASDNIDPDTRNMQTVSKHTNVTLCLWANLFKNPSFTGFDFNEAGLSFKLPEELAVSDIAVRILHTHYDHLSILSRLRHTPQKPIVEEIPPPEESMIPTQTEVLSGHSSSLKSTLLFKTYVIFHLEIKGFSLSTAKDPSWPSLAQLNCLSSAGPEFEETENDSEVVNLIQYTTLGGVFYYDLLQLPPQPIRRKGYTILQVIRIGLKVFPYPTERPKNEECPDDPTEAPNNKPCSPVGVCVVLPEWVIFMEMPLVARWDAEDGRWRKDGITNVSYEEAEGKISFEMESFQIFTLMHNTFANFPFQGWELRPLGQNSAVFTVKGALIEVSITIKARHFFLFTCCWRKIFRYELNGFYFENILLLSALFQNPLIEQFAYDQMALFASACAFKWSKWNDTCGEENLVLQGSEHLKIGLVPEDSWSTYFMGSQRTRQLEITENSEDFSIDHAAGSEFHSTLIHLLQDSMSPDGLALVRQSHYCFIDTVQTLLSATRPLVFS
uniref:Dynein axonemal intermediate chain 7 n=1 Tax=Xiphophorus couchianus TaxID=32473 RepID=A0A3B5LNR9_9TELE